MASVLIRVSDHAITDTNVCTVICGNAFYSIEAGESFVFPEITETRCGFIPEGWTDGENLYLPGEALKINEAFSFYIRYKRTEIFSAMDMAK